jgi:aryl-alcohol dehydrogenase-like predicted oxidoreductase
MQYTTLGRTGLKVSALGLGAGGPSRLGQRNNKTEADSIAIVRQALDAGVNFIDTAEAYNTEEIVGKAIKGVQRDSIVISTKKRTSDELTPDEVITGLNNSLKRLGTDYVDIYNLHGVRLARYDYLLENIVPVFQQLQAAGKIRFLGITEAFERDKEHQMLQRALQDDIWDVMMVGFNLLNQSARENVFAHTIKQNIGVQVMFAVRRALSRPDKLKEAIQMLIEARELNSNEINVDDPFDFVLTESDAVSLTDAAYRFCRDEPGAHVILSGTGNPEHLKANIESLTRPPLPPEVVDKLKYIFRQAVSVSGQ